MKFMSSLAVLLTALTIHSASAQSKLTPLTNADVIRLVAMRVSDETVIAVIGEAKMTQLDVSAAAVDQLTAYGVSAAVIDAMRSPSTSQRRPNKGTAAPEPPLSGALPTPPASNVSDPYAVPKITKATFEPVYRAAKAVQGATASGVTYVQFLEFMQTFSTALDVAKDHELNYSDEQLLADYRKAYETYHYSAEIWAIQLSHRDSPVSTTTFDYGQLWRYGIQTQTVRTKAGEVQVIPPNSMQRVWQQADAILVNATEAYLAK